MAQNTGTMTPSAEKTGGLPERVGDIMQRLHDNLPGAFFRPSQVEDAGMTRHQLRTLVRWGVVEHVARGLYRFADAEPTERYSIAMVCARVPNGIVCLLSALSVYEIGTQLPHEVWLAIAHKAEPPRVPGIQVRLRRVSGAAWSFGVRDTTFEGVPARITSPARTVVDCFRFERLIGREAALEALHDALRQRKVSTDELMRTLEVLPSRRLRAALESMEP
jgi:predicted transcriptional regulator of viral defense system